MEREELAVEIQQILYQQFGDTVCCRWRLLPYSSRPRHKPPGSDVIETPSFPVPRTFTPKQTSTDVPNGQVPLTIDQVFEQAGPKLPSMKTSATLNDSTDSIFNVDSSSLVQLQCKSRNKIADSHKTFNSNSFPKSKSNIYWTGKMRKSRFFMFELCGNLQTVI